MAVAFDAVSSTFVHGSEVTSINLGTLTVGAGSNRALVVQVGLDRNHNAQTWSSVTMNWDSAGTPQACTNIIGANSTGTGGNSSRVELWGLVNPTSGNKNLALSWTTNQEIFVCAAAWTGVDQTGGSTTFAHATSATGTSTSPAVSVTSAVGNAVMSVMTCISFISAVGQTKTFNCNDAGGGDFCGSAGNRADGAATVNLTYTIDSSVWAVAAVDIVAAADATLDQIHYRWRNNDGSETTATYKAPEDTPITAPAGTARLRFAVKATGDPSPDQYGVEWQLESEGVWRLAR